jgi:L-aminopeptidase/D-esterase-like protein
VLAGARSEGGFAYARTRLVEGTAPGGRFGNTTLAVLGTNADLDRPQLGEVARAATDALAWRIRPVGTAVDGDIIFAVAPGGVTVKHELQVQLMAQDALAMAIERAVTGAQGIGGVPGLADAQ